LLCRDSRRILNYQPKGKDFRADVSNDGKISFCNIICLNGPNIGKYGEDYDFKYVIFTDGDHFTAGC
jgi:hypothetical protein